MPESPGQMPEKNGGLDPSLQYVKSMDLRPRRFGESMEGTQFSSPEKKKPSPKPATIAEIIEDLKATPAIQAKFAPSSISPIGSGGMGVVVTADDPTLGRTQAIKILTGTPTLEATERFTAEARVIASLNDPSLVKIYDFGVSRGGRPYFVMDLVKGAQTLETSIDEFFKAAVSDPTKVQWRSRDNQLIRYFLETLRAVEYLHDKSIIHHDLKPANILISSEGPTSSSSVSTNLRRVFVTDFGLSRADSLSDSDLSSMSTTPEGSNKSSGFAGTLRYAAPEQFPGGDPVTLRTDVYQLGLILRNILLNQVPFENRSIGSPGELFDLITTAKDPVSLYGDPLLVNPALPHELVAIMHKALNKDPLQRYPHAGEMREDLEAFLDGHSVAAFAGGLSNLGTATYQTKKAAAGASRWVRANKLMAATIVALSVGGVGAGLWLMDQQNKDAEARIAALQVEEETKRLEAEIRQAQERTRDVLNSAREMASAGKLDAAVALVQPELLEDLKRYADRNEKLKLSLNTLEKEHVERKKLLDMKNFEIKGYAAAVAGTRPGVFGSFDREALLTARACFLPKGLTPEGIREFSEMMNAAHYSQQQRTEILEALTRICLCLITADNSDVPWSLNLSPELRRELVEECGRIYEVVLACRVKVDGDPSQFALPVILVETRFGIQQSLNLETQQPIFNSPFFGCDNTLWAFYKVYKRTNPEDLKTSLRFAEQAFQAAPEDLLPNILYAYVLLNIPANNPRDRYQNMHSALNSLINACKATQAGTLHNSDLAVQVFTLAGELAKASTSIPSLQRQSPGAEFVDARKLLKYEESLVQQAEVKRGLALMLLLEGAGSKAIEKMGDELKTSPRFKDDAILIRVWNALHMNGELNREEAQYLLDRNLSSRAPMLTAQVLERLGRSEEAISLLEQVYQTEPAWGQNIQRHSLTRFKSLHDRYGDRFKRLTIVPQ